MLKTIFTWLATLFDEKSSNSFSRFITLVIVAFVLGWDCCYLKWSHKLIDVETMVGQVGFMTAFYFIRRGAGVLTDRRPDAENDPSQQH